MKVNIYACSNDRERIGTGSDEKAGRADASARPAKTVYSYALQMAMMIFASSSSMDTVAMGEETEPSCPSVSRRI